MDVTGPLDGERGGGNKKSRDMRWGNERGTTREEHWHIDECALQRLERTKTGNGSGYVAGS
jgi:hypothetical protein